MAIYTYDQFEKAARDAGLYDSFSSADMSLAKQNPDAGMSILKYKQDWMNATTDEARILANQGAESVRKNYGGYVGGGDGGSFSIAPLSPSSFKAEPVPAYESRYDGQIQSLFSELINRKEFSYDADADPLYGQYRKAYAREGERATQDALGSVAAASGGIPSSYAVTAATQAGDYYASKMSDKVPELYQIAYQKYLDEYQRKANELATALNAEQIDYSKYLDKLSQYNTDRTFNYGQILDEINNQARERAEAQSNAQLAAQYGDYSGLAALGIDTSNNPAETERKWNEAITAAQYGDYSGLRALGINPNADVTVDDPRTNGLTETDIAAIKQAYGGTELTQEQWDGILNSNPGVTADDLTAAGFTVKTAPEKEEPKPGEEPINFASVLALGYGMISEERLLELEAAGEIVSYVEGGTRKFRKVEKTENGTILPDGTLLPNHKFPAIAFNEALK